MNQGEQSKQFMIIYAFDHAERNIARTWNEYNMNRTGVGQVKSTITAGKILKMSYLEWE